MPLLLHTVLTTASAFAQGAQNNYGPGHTWPPKSLDNTASLIQGDTEPGVGGQPGRPRGHQGHACTGTRREGKTGGQAMV